MKKSITSTITRAIMMAALIFCIATIGTSCQSVQKKLVETYIEKYQKTLPQKIDEGMVITKIEADGNNLIYIIELDESIYDFSVISENKAAAEDAIKQELRQQVATDEDVKSLIDLGYSITYKYVGNQSGQSTNVTILNSDLK